MNNKRKQIDMISLSVLPFLTLLIVALSQFVTTGFKAPDDNWWLQLLINSTAMASFWLPAQSYAFRKEKDSERTKTAEGLYKEQVHLVYNESETGELRAWCKNYTAEYTENFIHRRLSNAGVLREVFDNLYKNNNKAIRSDKALTYRQKKYLINANRFRKIRQLKAEALLPNLKSENEYYILESTLERAEAVNIAKKLFNITLIGTALSMIFITTSENTDVLAIIMSFALKLFTGMMNFASGLYSGKRLVEKNYVGDIALKTERLQEFHARQADSPRV